MSNLNEEDTATNEAKLTMVDATIKEPRMSLIKLGLYLGGFLFFLEVVLSGYALYVHRQGKEA